MMLTLAADTYTHRGTAIVLAVVAGFLVLAFARSIYTDGKQYKQFRRDRERYEQKRGKR